MLPYEVTQEDTDNVVTVLFIMPEIKIMKCEKRLEEGFKYIVRKSCQDEFLNKNAFLVVSIK